MLRQFLERLGILNPVKYTRTRYQVVVYVMSDGTAQGIPRPLQVLKHEQIYNLDDSHMNLLHPRYRMDGEVATILRRGYSHELSDGTRVMYAPHTIYKITSKEITNDD